MAVAYDYIVTIRATRKDGSTEEYRHPVQAYTINDAMMTALIELDAEHGITAGECKVLSVRPDVEKIGEQTRSMIEQMAASMNRRVRP